MLFSSWESQDLPSRERAMMLHFIRNTFLFVTTITTGWYAFELSHSWTYAHIVVFNPVAVVIWVTGIMSVCIAIAAGRLVFITISSLWDWCADARQKNQTMDSGLAYLRSLPVDSLRNKN